ncbi:uncharacterized protein LOC113854137 [Abrus precatorius]|uniref:Uncharacterized protein LOC113854137 n=1 Tax=Abrus precatorius TaxID=3816 RepID=A0A8B8KAR1_ABRPR|nr:uncharacterized protein LOC113854137 [Abrus precatorius]
MDSDKERQEVSDHEEESYENEEKMKGSQLGSFKDEAESMMVDEVALYNSAPGPRECNICGKTFRNGKALGGHRRSHFQALRKNQRKVKARFPNQNSRIGDINNRAICDYDDDDDVNDDPFMCDGKFTCFLCKKEFPSKNSLFGHMKSHPERSWRGVFPPTHHPHKHSSSSHNSDSMENHNEDEEDDDFVPNVAVLALDEEHVVLDLLQFTSPSWLTKDKRGRRCIGGYAAAETLAFIYSYAKLYRGESSNNKAGVEQNTPEVPTPQVPWKCNKSMIGESSTSGKPAGKKIKIYFSEMQVENKVEESDDCDDSDMVDGDDDEEDVMNENVDAEETLGRVQDHAGHFGESKLKKVEKGKNIENLALNKSKARDSEYVNEGQENLGGYKCGTCGKSFSTFQGLGGHRSIHKEKNIATMNASKASEAVAEENHSRSTSNMNKMDEASLNEETEADEACQSSGAKKMNFDLNEPYAMED